MKPTVKQFSESVAAMSEVIPFFPKSETAKKLLATLLAQFVNTKPELDWLTLKSCELIRDWEKSGGIAELRGLFCTQFAPADGIAADCTTPGYRAEEREARFFSQELEQDARRLESYQRKALANPDEPQMVPLPPVKRLQ